MSDKVKKASVAAVMTGVALGAAALGAGSASAAPARPAGVVTIQGTCGDTYNPSVGGGAAGWTITCAAGKVRVQGWVKDTDADGKAAEVYGTWEDGAGFGTVRAGGEGKKVEFDKGHKGSSVKLYLRVI